MPGSELNVGDKVYGFDPPHGNRKFIATIKRIEGKYAILDGCPGEGCCPLEYLRKQESDPEVSTLESKTNVADGAI